jgi:hypothetical protein
VEANADFSLFELQYAAIFTAETFCYGDVLFRRRFVTGDVPLRRRFVTETFCMETFCRGDVLCGDVLYVRQYLGSDPELDSEIFTSQVG